MTHHPNSPELPSVEASSDPIVHVELAEQVRLDFHYLPEGEMIERAEAFFHQANRRRSVRIFSDRAVPRPVLEHCLRAASTAPSGANLQPWHFVVVSDPEVKKKIRAAAEIEERAFYSGRAPEEWLNALKPLGTNSEKPFLEIAPCLIAIFAQSYHLDDAGNKIKHYYVSESVGIATGILMTALHNAGLACLTHTPSPMGFLNGILQRPNNERPFLLLVVGYPPEDVTVPRIRRKEMDDYVSFL
jgi:iodotyrosine deiodinase